MRAILYSKTDVCQHRGKVEKRRFGRRAARELEPKIDPIGGDLRGQVLWEPDWDAATQTPGNTRPGSVNDRPGLNVDRLGSNASKL